MKKIRYGTRGSALALAQSGQIAQLLRDRTGLEVERVVITTSGDRFALAQPPDAPGATPNVKAMFVKEIEEALLAGTIDLAVHSAKDLPAEIPEGLVLASIPAREDPRDAFIPGAKVESFEKLPKDPKIATGSLRRQIQLRLARPDAAFVPIRGNVDTRLGRLDRGEFDGMVLAMAGLKRLGIASRRLEALPFSVVIPAPGQGALALEARADRSEVLQVLSSVEDPATRIEVETERAFLAQVGGGCQTPLGCLARAEGGRVAIEAFWSETDGSRPVRKRAEGASKDGPALARALAKEMLRR